MTVAFNVNLTTHYGAIQISEVTKNVQFDRNTID